MAVNILCRIESLDSVEMQEIRWNPVLSEWVIIASHRESRPLDAGASVQTTCPFCPPSPEVEGDWDVKVLPNKFPLLVPDPPPPQSNDHWLYKVRPGRGVCEVVLETKEHDADLADLPVGRLKRVLEVFAERYRELAAKPYVRYVFIFRNKGREIGVTLHHPHSQIACFPFIPPLIRRELRSSQQFMRKRRKCLFCTILDHERRTGQRVVFENESFTVFLPFYARWPYETQIFPRRHIQSLADLKPREFSSLADALKRVLVGYNELFGFSMPYIMALHQKPTDKRRYGHYHFHIEFYPPYRNKDILKFPAGVERATGTFTYDYEPESKAQELRTALGRADRPE
jgi:UDPglucose--hexose-1-phosphate uridylyltransferase